MNEYKKLNFIKFKKSVLEYSEINIDTLYLLLNRITHSSKKNYFGYSRDAKFNSRLKYHRHWIKMLEGDGTLIPIDFQKWKVNKKGESIE